jgi:hypothetical protein
LILAGSGLLDADGSSLNLLVRQLDFSFFPRIDEQEWGVRPLRADDRGFEHMRLCNSDLVLFR